MSTGKITLSKSVMNMRFMKRKEEEEEQMVLEQQTRASMSANWISSSNNYQQKSNSGGEDPSNGIVQFIDDSMETESIIPGRRSFGGFNKVVEQHYHKMVDDQAYQIKLDNSKSQVSDEEVMKQYETLVALPRGPNQGKKSLPKIFNKHLNKKNSASSGNSPGNKVHANTDEINQASMDFTKKRNSNANYQSYGNKKIKL